MPITKLHGWQVEYSNEREYHVLKQEIFSHDCYWFDTQSEQPRILDVGAHIGLATLYFLTVAPTARVTAIEPNPLVRPLLESNIWMNHLEDRVTIEPFAVAETAGLTELYLDTSADQWWSTASFSKGAWTQDQMTYPIEVTTRPLTDWLIEPYDVVKMDIEGAEQAVLFQAGTALEWVQTLLVEFHPVPNQSLPGLVKYLQNQGFSVTIWKKGQQLTLHQAGNSLVLLKATK